MNQFDTFKTKIKTLVARHEQLRVLNRLFVLLKYKFYKVMGSHSQYGEDAILAKLLKKKRNGFYIDVGANHPKNLSNTHYFYKRGFRGINIEANPNLIKEFELVRKEDINLNIGISNQASEMTFYLSSADTLGSFDLQSVTESCKIHGAEMIGEIKVKTELLKNVIAQYAPDKHIDFMSVDVEGHDLEVLQSNDWEKYRPEFLIVETNINTSNLNIYLKEIGYNKVYENHTNSIYRDCRAN